MLALSMKSGWRTSTMHDVSSHAERVLPGLSETPRCRARRFSTLFRATRPQQQNKKRDSQMSMDSTTAYAPLAPAAETLTDPQFTIRDKSQAMLVCYCPRNRCGAIYHIDPGMWCLWVPIDLPSFLGSLHDRKIELAAGPDLESWLDAVSTGDISKGRGLAN